MQRYRPPLLLLCAGVVLALSTADGQEPGKAAGPQIGQKAPEIKGKDTEGKAFKLSDYRGKVVVLDFWGDW